MDNDFYKGAILDNGGVEPNLERWQLTNNDEHLLAADEDKVLWVSTADQLKSELELRYPCDTPGLTRVWYNGYAHVYVYQHPVLNSGDPDRAWNAIQQAGTICVTQQHYARELQRSKRFDGCIFKFPNCGPATITYNPKQARKLAAKKEQKRLNTQVTVAEIAALMYKLEQATDPPFPRPGTYGASDRKTYVTFLMARLVVFNVLYGKNAHRKFKPWQDFVAIWKLRKDASDKKYREAKLDSFVNLMDKECRAKRVPPLPDEHFSKDKRPTEIRLP